ncbi:MAG: hypothetical protein IJ794_01590 [Lachnospiraceae bacterium]|nr:hypothetical protein [Lachnospiraceae bacterium]
MQIFWKVINDEKGGKERLYSFDPKDQDYRLLGMLRVCDEGKGEDSAWEELVDLHTKLRYGFLDELIENTIFQWAKGIAGDPDGMIGGYRVDNPVVFWMCHKETFDKVVSGQSIYDVRMFQGEITGDNKDGNQIRILLFNNRKAQVFLDGDFKAVFNLKNIKEMTFEETISVLENAAWENTEICQ